MSDHNNTIDIPPAETQGEETPAEIAVSDEVSRRAKACLETIVLTLTRHAVHEQVIKLALLAGIEKLAEVAQPVSIVRDPEAEVATLTRELRATRKLCGEAAQTLTYAHRELPLNYNRARLIDDLRKAAGEVSGE